MGNLKKMFYKDYYDGFFNLKIENGKEKKKEERVAEYFREKNEAIVQYRPDLGEAHFHSLNLAGRKGLTVLTFELTTTYPGLTIGTGYMHEMHKKEEFKLGFFFDHTTGLPLLPGSSVKGVLRSAFPTFEPKKDNILDPDFEAKDKKGNLKITEKQKQKARFIQALLPVLAEKTDEELFPLVHRLEKVIFEGTDISATKGPKEKKVPMTKRCIFYDAHIKYAAPDGRIVGADVLTPHTEGALKDPIPLPFLKVLPDVTFEFSFTLPEEIKVDDISLAQNDLKQLFKNILSWSGMGAKTNVGYGRFTEKKPKPAARSQRESAQRGRPQNIVPSDIPKDTQIEATLVEIRGEFCVFKFTYKGNDFQFVKKIGNITNKWQDGGCQERPKENTTYRLRTRAEIRAGQNRPNFTVKKPG